MTLKNFVSSKHQPSKVRWIETRPLKTMINTNLVDADLDISQRLVDFLFTKFPTIVLCSATLTTNKQFDFFRKRLGLTTEKLPNRIVTENAYSSPFNFQQQALLAIPTDIPHPHAENFPEAVVEKIWQAIQASHGNAFVLFTSYSLLNTCYEQLKQRLCANRYSPMKQGEENRQALLDRFKATNRSVLFGTDSFWEGVDVVGEALRCVIIVKLPFKVPTEPIIQARAEAILARGGDPFYEYSLPHAIVKFMQGFGRLIRHKKDRGCIVCLDQRILSKNYGKLFLNSLPTCQEIFANSDVLHQKMIDFYKKTYYLVKK